MAIARTDMVREIYTYGVTCPSVLRIDGDVNQPWRESREAMRLSATPAMELVPFNG